MLAFGPSAVLPGYAAGWDDFQRYCNDREEELTDAARDWHEYDAKTVVESFAAGKSDSSPFEEMLSGILGGGARVRDYRIGIVKVHEQWATTVFIGIGAIELAADAKWPPSPEEMKGLTSFFAFAEGREWILHRFGDSDDFLEPEARSGPTGAFNLGVEAHKAGNLPGAGRFFRRAAKAGVFVAQFNMGLFYHRGLGVAPDLAKAAYWFERSAERNFPDAQHSIALCYANGYGVPVDKLRALYWCERAASLGYLPSMMNFALMHFDGDGTAQDRQTAFAWFLKAAERGLPEAQQSTATLYMNGWGVGANPVEALKWLEILSLRGFEAEHKQSIEQLMTPEQVASARNLASDWLARFQTDVQVQ